MGDLNEARIQYHKALGMKRHALAEDHPDLFRTQNNLAALELKCGDVAKAYDHYQIALRILDRVSAHEGGVSPVHEDLLLLLHSISLVSDCLSKHEERDRYLERCKVAEEAALAIQGNFPDPSMLYSRACTASLGHDYDVALSYLTRACQGGWRAGDGGIRNHPFLYSLSVAREEESYDLFNKGLGLTEGLYLHKRVQKAFTEEKGAAKHNKEQDNLEAESRETIMKAVMELDTYTPRVKRAASVRALLRRDSGNPAPDLEYDDGDWGWDSRGDRTYYNAKTGELSEAGLEPQRNTEYKVKDFGGAAAAYTTYTNVSEVEVVEPFTYPVDVSQGDSNSLSEIGDPVQESFVVQASPTAFPMGDSDDDA